MTRVLVAGVGNIFCGDDAYGVEVANRLLRRTFPSDVNVEDFGIRGLELAYALADGYDFVIIVDAAARGQEPGSISVVEPEQTIDGANRPLLLGSAHGLDPGKVLGLATTLGGTCKRILFVLCEPFTLGDEDGQMGLSDVVAASVEPSVHLVENLVTSFLREGEVALGDAC